MLSAIYYCHEKNISHRDIKEDNIMVTKSGFVKLIDFGLAQPLKKNEHKMHRVCGTLHYMAPELLEGQYTEKCDMWAIGVVLYRMLSEGQTPFHGLTEEAIE